jgi:hypothetical protein
LAKWYFDLAKWYFDLASDLLSYLLK